MCDARPLPPLCTASTTHARRLGSHSSLHERPGTIHPPPVHQHHPPLLQPALLLTPTPTSASPLAPLPPLLIRLLSLSRSLPVAVASTCAVRDVDPQTDRSAHQISALLFSFFPPGPDSFQRQATATAASFFALSLSVSNFPFCCPSFPVRASSARAFLSLVALCTHQYV